MPVEIASPNPKILIAFTGTQSHALGNIWTITASQTGFYLKSFDRRGDVVHASLHNPNDDNPTHRFHLKVDDKVASRKVANDEAFVAYDIPKEGRVIPGRTIGDRAYLAARIRWTWDLDRDKFRSFSSNGQVPNVQDHHTPLNLHGPLEPNMAWDIDIVVSFDEPYWPDGKVTERNGSRAKPLHDGKSMYLTATSYKRSQSTYPTPAGLKPRLPRSEETPNRILCGGPDELGFYWFVETIASKEELERAKAASSE